MKKCFLLFEIVVVIILTSCKSPVKSDIILAGNMSTYDNSAIDKQENVILHTVQKLNKKESYYFFRDEESNNWQSVELYWYKEDEFRYDLIADTDLCVYKVGGKGVFKSKNIYTVLDHPIIKEIHFNKNKTILSLVCKFPTVHDECEPIEDFQMKLTKK